MKPGSNQLPLPVGVDRLGTRQLEQVPEVCRMYTEAGMRQAPVGAGATVQVVGKQGNWGTGGAAVVAGIDAGLGAWWTRTGHEERLQLSKPRASSLAAAAGIAGGQ